MKFIRHGNTIASLENICHAYLSTTEIYIHYFGKDEVVNLHYRTKAEASYDFEVIEKVLMGN